MDDFEILFVDDDRTILNMVEEYLAAFDYRVYIVDSGLKALELIKDKDFDVVFLIKDFPIITFVKNWNILLNFIYWLILGIEK